MSRLGGTTRRSILTVLVLVEEYSIAALVEAHKAFNYYLDSSDTPPLRPHTLLLAALVYSFNSTFDD